MRRILVADDDDAIVSSLKLFFEDSYEVLTARDGREAVRVVEQQLVDLLLLDMLMPLLDGEGVVAELAARELDVPVVLASAHADVAALAQRLGSDGWVAKPFDPDALERTVADVLARRAPDSTTSHHAGRAR